MDHPDHRRIGRELGVYASEELCGAGFPLWLPGGAAIRSEIERFVIDLERRAGYHHVYSPVLGRLELYQRSGHWQHYQDNMFPPMEVGGERVLLRPMLCPHHILVFSHQPRGLRDMPYRVAELGAQFRLERSGVVGGLSRTRQMTLNDGHVFCPADQIEEEIGTILAMVETAYRALAIPPPSYRLSLGGQGPKYVGDRQMWRRAEDMARAALEGLGLAYSEAAGEAAFYGPKIDLQVRDPRGREETLSTVQIDFHLPRQFGLEFRRGSETEMPVMLHRSIVSTMERMVAHVLEVHDGRLPLWLSPVQVVVVPVSAEAASYARRVGAALVGAGVRAEVDDREETLSARVRLAHDRMVPCIAVVGEREVAAGSVTLRLRGHEEPVALALGSFASWLTELTAGMEAGLRPPEPPA
ncbi:MAG TPA: threonine--tRNA ligase [Acidimicrobiales bacterium]|nr:threonine--tRNA ligase [Acidimicrobiales bacterium]